MTFEGVMVRAHAPSAPRLVVGSLLLWLPLLLWGSCPAPPPWVAPPLRTTLPGEGVVCSLGDGVLVHVEGVPIRCSVDTGQSVALLLEPDAARRAGLKAQGRLRLGDGSSSGRCWAQRIWVEELALGEARFEGVPAAILTTPLHAPGIEGTIGYSLFRRCAFELDLLGEHLVVLRSGSEAGDGTSRLALDDSEGLPRVGVRLEGRSVTAILDSGNRAGLLVPETLAKSLELRLEPRREHRLRTLFRQHAVTPGRLREPLAIGRFHLPELEFLASGDLPELNVGAGILRRFVVHFDSPGQRVLLRPADPERWRRLAER